MTTAKKLFISHAAEDTGFARRLADRLSSLYAVFSYEDNLKASNSWDREIEDELRKTDVFLVLISDASNKSKWVGRETLFAERYEIPSVPLYLNGPIPLRLIDKSYVDFSGDFDGGMTDLLQTIKKHAEPTDLARHESDRLLGAGLREFLAGNIAKANNLVSQAQIMCNEIDVSSETIWALLRSRDVQLMNEQYVDSIRIVERTKKQWKNIYAPDFEATYRWNLSLEAERDVLEQVDHVTYLLDPTFSEWEQTVRNKASGFTVSRLGWGPFEVRLEVYFMDGTSLKGAYTLSFEKECKVELSMVIR